MDIETDYNNYMTYDEIVSKYSHLGLTKSKTYIRQKGLKRNRPCFTNRFNLSLQQNTNQHQVSKPKPPIIPIEPSTNIVEMNKETDMIIKEALQASKQARSKKKAIDKEFFSSEKK